MGQVFRLPWARVDSLAEAISELGPLASVDSVAVENLADATPLTDATFPDRSMLVIGNEGHGIDTATLAACPQRFGSKGPAIFRWMKVRAARTNDHSTPRPRPRSRFMPRSDHRD